MAELLHEFWKTDQGGEFGIVTADRDRQLTVAHPGGRVAWQVRAPSFVQAVRRFNEECLGDFSQTYDEYPDVPYSDEDAAAQDAYLAVRVG